MLRSSPIGLGTAICCVAALLIMASCSRDAGSPDQPSQLISRGLPGEPHSLDPFEADDNFSLQVLRDLWEGLTNIDGAGEVVPGVAKDWSVAGGGTIYEFHLRRDAKWSDGKNVVAQQFVAGFRHAVDPATASGSAPLLSLIKNASDIANHRMPVDALGATAPDDYTLRIELERPAPYILQILAEPIGAPRRNGSADFSSSRITEGPYTVTERRPGSYVLLQANPNYWDRTNVHIRTTKYVISESESAELRQYLANQLDLTYTVPIADLPRMQREHADELQSAPILGTMYLALNLSSNLGSKPLLREALSIAIDRESITKKLTLGASAAYGFVADGVSNYSAFRYEWAAMPRDQQIELAKSNYAKSGYSNSNPLKVTLYYNNNESINRIMVAVADSWARHLGVQTNMVGEEFRVFLEGRKDRSKWDAARLGWWADFNDASSFLEIFTSSGTQNDPGYTDKGFDELIEKSRREPDQDQRAALLSKAERKLLTDYPIVPVYFYSAKHLVKRNVRGASISPMNRTYSRLLSRQ